MDRWRSVSDQYRVGRRCPWNIYRINPANESRDHDDRFWRVYALVEVIEGGDS